MERRDFIKAGALTCVSGMLALSGCTFQEVSNEEVVKQSQKVIGDKQYGFAINVTKLNELGIIDDIIEACHSAHNVPKIDDPKRSIDWIWTQSFSEAFIDYDSEYMDEKTLSLEYPVLCNHCTEPPCVRACPTQTTFKRSDGIVVMDYHRCIGCRFCMSACPYGARSLNFSDPRLYLDEVEPGYPTRSKGVVEKCTMCYELIDAGKLPICAEASQGAIVFGDLKDESSEIRKVLARAFSIRRRVELGTGPNVYYIFEDGE
ncbi:MAG: 4Fe-4S dicluster domain-containing protein [Eggerthellaceae bacterium]|nr:4Fe-4S dicluster domain-containing protein [Eggerthellaceae bacterium]